MEVSQEEKERAFRERMVVITFKIPRYLLEAIDKYRLRTGESRSNIIRRAITEFLKKRGYKL